uniref:Glyoxysomal processing protease, glyoxysomal n=1 Tax=Ananas comosus var. bracteatus TaxID=296719 RepID=A0A6V7NKL0_ANACO|nr:unnamed protein product [Ananas comosus var. bracteatus]
MMESPEIARIGREFAAMVRIQGPDPKSLKMRRRAFHLHQSGITTLSASGILLPAAVFDGVRGEFSPKLIPNACIDVLLEGEEANSSNESNANPYWLPSQLLALVDVPASSVALSSMVGAHSGLLDDTSWQVGWSFNHFNITSHSSVNDIRKQVGTYNRPSLESYKNYVSDETSHPSLMVKSVTRLAILGISTTKRKNALHIDVSQCPHRGDLLLVIGSPFGILSPLHFLNSISVGAVGNSCPSNSHQSSLLMADIRCLPGMEGGPVFDRHASLVGMLTSPLRQKGSNAEIQLVITWDAIASSWQLKKENQGAREELGALNVENGRTELLPHCETDKRSVFHAPKDRDFHCLSPSSWKMAISSVALITVGDGAWASGIVLNNRGLVLTNAHLLEPWRFGRNSLGPTNKSHNVSSHGEEHSSKDGFEFMVPSIMEGSIPFGDSKHQSSLQNSGYKSYGKILVRLDYTESHVWSDAGVVYVSKGPLDVALLQLETLPSQLFAIKPKFACPSAAEPVHVIGHGLLGPRPGFGSSISRGVVSNVVRILRPLHTDKFSTSYGGNKNIPVMLQTTAAVHPGASGGAVVNSEGLMVGLVTSNARHGGGSTIPHMNFSIPCAALEPVFRFSEEGDMSLLRALDKPDELLTSVWALASSPSPSPKSLLEKNKREGKGSRFSKFLAEQNSENLEKLIQGKINSKI